MRIMPIYEGTRFEDWKLVHLNMIVLSDAPGGRPGSPGNPEPVEGGRATGLRDIFHGTFYTPITNSDWTIGYGPWLAFQLQPMTYWAAANGRQGLPSA